MTLAEITKRSGAEHVSQIPSSSASASDGLLNQELNHQNWRERICGEQHEDEKETHKKKKVQKKRNKKRRKKESFGSPAVARAALLLGVDVSSEHPTVCSR